MLAHAALIVFMVFPGIPLFYGDLVPRKKRHFDLRAMRGDRCRFDLVGGRLPLLPPH